MQTGPSEAGACGGGERDGAGRARSDEQKRRPMAPSHDRPRRECKPPDGGAAPPLNKPNPTHTTTTITTPNSPSSNPPLPEYLVGVHDGGRHRRARKERRAAGAPTPSQASAIHGGSARAWDAAQTHACTHIFHPPRAAAACMHAPMSSQTTVPGSGSRSQISAGPVAPAGHAVPNGRQSRAWRELARHECLATAHHRARRHGYPLPYIASDQRAYSVARHESS